MTLASSFTERANSREPIPASQFTVRSKKVDVNFLECILIALGVFLSNSLLPK
jgi:hypothetical protein